MLSTIILFQILLFASSANKPAREVCNAEPNVILSTHYQGERLSGAFDIDKYLASNMLGCSETPNIGWHYADAGHEVTKAYTDNVNDADNNPFRKFLIRKKALSILRTR